MGGKLPQLFVLLLRPGPFRIAAEGFAHEAAFQRPPASGGIGPVVFQEGPEIHPGAGEETETSVETETSAETETEALTLNPRLMAPPDLWGASGHESWTPAS